jgi:hypothetical protein
MAQVSLLIIYQRAWLAIVFLILHLIWVAGWLRQKPQAEQTQHGKVLLLSRQTLSPSLLEMAIK